MRRCNIIFGGAVCTLFGVFLVSCQSEKSFIPSYIKIDSFYLDASGIGGSNAHDIQAVQVYVNNQTVGTFSNSAEFPVDAQGLTTITATPFVKNNGNSQNLVPFRSLDLLKDSLLLQREKTVRWSPKFQFRSNTKIVWQEDFEDSSSTLVPILRDSFDYFRIETRDYGLNGQYQGNSKVFVSRFSDADTFKLIDLAYFQKISDLPTDGTDIILEFDVKSELPVFVDLLRYSSNKAETVPFLTVNPTKGNWKRFYLNLSLEVAGQPKSNQYEIFFRIDKWENFSGSKEILFDNIRLSYLSN